MYINKIQNKNKKRYQVSRECSGEICYLSQYRKECTRGCLSVVDDTLAAVKISVSIMFLLLTNANSARHIWILRAQFLLVLFRFLQ